MSFPVICLVERRVFRFPPPSLPRFDLIRHIGLNAAAIALPAVAIHITVAKVVEKRYKYKINHGQVSARRSFKISRLKSHVNIFLGIVRTRICWCVVFVLSSFPGDIWICKKCGWSSSRRIHSAHLSIFIVSSCISNPVYRSCP